MRKSKKINSGQSPTEGKVYISIIPIVFEMVVQTQMGFSRVYSFFLIFLMLIGLFSVGVSAQEDSDATGTTETGFVFNPETAGVTPNVWYYPFVDWTHTPEECLAEAGLMAESGDYESMRRALENFDVAVANEVKDVESTSLDGVTLESIESQSHEGFQNLVDFQGDVLTYKEYANAIEEILDTQVESGQVSEEDVSIIVDELNTPINEVGATFEEVTHDLVQEVADNSDVSPAKVEIVYDNYIKDEYGGRTQEIADINDFLELDAKIAELEIEADALRESGDETGAVGVERLLTLAKSHGEDCLNSEEGNFEAQVFNHLNSAENIVDNVEAYLAGEYSNLEDMPVWSPYSIEDIENEISMDGESATKFIADYDTLREEYKDDAGRLAWIEQEKKRSEKRQEVAEKLPAVIDTWGEDLRANGLTEDEVITQINDWVVGEYEVMNGHYQPTGLYQRPGGTTDNINSDVGMGRMQVIETIDPETGEIEKEIFGWYNGAPVEDVSEGGGFALNTPYKDDSGYTYTYGLEGYTVETASGVVHNIDYPEDYTPSSDYSYGDEVSEYTTDNGNVVTYSTTGYQVTDLETEEVLVDGAYTQEAVTFADGSSLDNKPTGYVFSNNDGESYVYSYNPETRSYTDYTTGKVFNSPTSSHSQRTVYDSVAGTYSYAYNGDVWTTPGDGTWTSPTGQIVNLPSVPAPVGYEGEGSYMTPSGKSWTYDSAKDTWTETTTGASYTPSPNNYIRYDERTGYMTGSRGEALASVGTSVTINGETFTVTAENGWTNSQGQATAPPYDSMTGRQYPSSATGMTGGASGSGGYGGQWQYSPFDKTWVSSDTGDTYDPSTGQVTKSDGTVIDSNRPAGEDEGSCYGCYYQGGQGSEGTSGQPRAYTYDSGSYARNVDGSYAYVESDGQYQGPTSMKDAQGTEWTRATDGSWSSTAGGTYMAGSNGIGGFAPGGYTPDGSYTAPSGGYSDGYSGGAYGSPAQSGGYGTYSPTTGWSGGEYGPGGYSYAADAAANAATWASSSPSSSGSWSGTTGDSWSGPTSGSYSGGDSGGSSGGGESGGSYSGGESGGSSGGGDSGGSSGGGDSGGSSGGGDSGGGSTGSGAVIAGEDVKIDNWFSRFLNKIFGN